MLSSPTVRSLYGYPEPDPHFLQTWLVCSNWVLEYSFSFESICPELIPLLVCSLQTISLWLSLTSQTDSLGQKHLSSGLAVSFCLPIPVTLNPKGLMNLWMNVQLLRQPVLFYPQSLGDKLVSCRVRAYSRQGQPRHARVAGEDHGLAGHPILLALGLLTQRPPPHLHWVPSQDTYPHRFLWGLGFCFCFCFWGEKRIIIIVIFLCEVFKEQIERYSEPIYIFLL